MAKLIFSRFLQDLSAFDPPFNTQKRGRMPIKEKPKSNAHQIDGNSWEENEAVRAPNYGEWAKVQPDKMGIRSPEIDALDAAWLDTGFRNTKKGWRKDLAAILKSYWAQVDPERPGHYYSAARVESVNRIGGKLADGFSERNIKEYYKAFNAAQREREGSDNG